jgi:hypothetical protein
VQILFLSIFLASFFLSFSCRRVPGDRLGDQRLLEGVDETQRELGLHRVDVVRLRLHDFACTSGSVSQSVLHTGDYVHMASRFYPWPPGWQMERV